MTTSQRGRAARARGIRFERRVAAAFRAAGFRCERILEYDGYNTGRDLRIGNVAGWLPIAIQCKCTARNRDLFAAFRKLRTTAPDEVRLTIHSWQRRGRSPVFRALLENRPGFGLGHFVTLAALVSYLKGQFIT